MCDGILVEEVQEPSTPKRRKASRRRMVVKVVGSRLDSSHKQ